METLFKNILILSNPGQVQQFYNANKQNQSDHLKIFQEAQKYLNDFNMNNLKQHYGDYFNVISGGSDDDDLQKHVDSNRILLTQDNQLQIKNWMISSLIKIVKSKQFSEEWTPQEKLAFKDFFLNWFVQRWSSVLSQPLFMKKVSLLFVYTFDGLARYSENNDYMDQPNIYQRQRMQNMVPQWQDAYADFIEKFIDLGRDYPAFYQFIQAVDTQQNDQTQFSQEQLQNEIGRYSMIIKFFLLCISDTFKTVLNWEKEDKEEEAEAGEEKDEEEKVDEPKQKKDQSDTRDIVERINLQRIFKEQNVPKILIVLENLVQFKIRGILGSINDSHEIQIYCWKILPQFLKFRFYGHQQYLETQNGSTNQINSNLNPQQKVHINNLNSFKLFIDTALQDIQNMQQLSVESLDLVRLSFKFLRFFIKSDVLSQYYMSDHHAWPEDPENERRTQKSIGAGIQKQINNLNKKINDLKQKLELVNLVSQCIHNENGAIYKALMMRTEDFSVQEKREKFITNLSQFLSESITYFRNESEQLLQTVKNLEGRYSGAHVRLAHNQGGGFVRALRESFAGVATIQDPVNKQNSAELIQGNLPNVNNMVNQDQLFGQHFRLSFNNDQKASKDSGPTQEQNVQTAPMSSATGFNLQNQAQSPEETDDLAQRQAEFQTVLAQIWEQIQQIRSVISNQLSQLMQLSIHLMRQYDPKIIRNACLIVHDYLLCIIQSQNQANLYQQKQLNTAPENGGSSLESEQNQIDSTYQNIFDEIIPIFIDKFKIPEDTDKKIRLSKLDTNLKNEDEDQFQGMRDVFQKLFHLLLQRDSIAQLYKNKIDELIGQMKQAIDSIKQGQAAGQKEPMIHRFELIYEMILTLLKDSNIYNINSRHNQPFYSQNQLQQQNQINSTTEQKTLLQDFIASAQFQWVMFDSDIIQFINDQNILNEDSEFQGFSANRSLSFYALHNGLLQIYQQLVCMGDNNKMSSYTSQNAGQNSLEANRIPNEQLFQVFIYLAKQVSNKIQLFGGNLIQNMNKQQQQISQEELDLLIDQIKFMDKILHQGKLSVEQVNLIKDQLNEDFMTLLAAVRLEKETQNQGLSMSSNEQNFKYIDELSSIAKIYLTSLVNLFAEAVQAQDQNARNQVEQQMQALSQGIIQVLSDSQQHNHIKLQKIQQRILVQIFMKLVNGIASESSILVQRLHQQLQNNIQDPVTQSQVQLINTYSLFISQQIESFLRLIQQRKLSSNLTENVIKMTKDIQNVIQQLQQFNNYSINSQQRVSLQNYTYASQVCVDLIQDLLLSDENLHQTASIEIQTSQRNDRMFKLELLNGILNLFLKQTLSLFNDGDYNYTNNIDYYQNDTQLLFSQIELVMSKYTQSGENVTLGLQMIKYLMIQTKPSNQGVFQSFNKKEQELMIDNQYLILNLIRDITLLGSGFMGIQSEVQLLEFVWYLKSMAMDGHTSSMHQFRILALQILRNISYEMLYDNQFNAQQNFLANKNYANFDQNYETAKRDSIISLNNSLVFTRGEAFTIFAYIAEKGIFFSNLKNCVQIIREIDELNFRLIWKLTNLKSNFYDDTNIQFLNSDEFEQMVQLAGLIIVGTTHIFPNHENNKQQFLEASQLVFSTSGTPSIEQIHQYIDAENHTILRTIKPEQFSLNFFKVDDSYPKRLWRLSKNIALRYDKKHWAVCYELRYSLMDYLNNSFQTPHDGNLAPRLQMNTGQPISRERFLERFVQNVKEYTKNQPWYQDSDANQVNQADEDEAQIEAFIKIIKSQKLQ